MDRSILKQYLSGFQAIKRPSFLLENSMALGNLPQNISYNGLLYTYNLQENAFINQFGHKIDASQASAFITEARQFNQLMPAAIMDLTSNASGDSPVIITVENGTKDIFVFSDPINPTTKNDITWDYVDGVDFDAVVVSYSATSPSGPFTTLTTITDTEIQYYAHTGVSAGETYYYRVSSSKNSVVSEGGTITFQTAGSTLPPVGVTAPSGLSYYTITTSTVGLTWSDNSNNERGFYIYQALGNSAQPLSIIRGTVPNQNSVLIQRLTEGTTYSFAVAAFGTGFTSALTNIITVKTLVSPPAQPKNLTATALGTSSIRANWDGATGLDYYNIARSTNNITYTSGVTLPAGSTTYTFTGLSQGTLYYVRLNAQNAGGTSAFAFANATTEGLGL
jgi:fibronectin type 3 domain-containing protein